MNKDFFKQVRILDGGMGQELHAKGLISMGTLWSASANLEKKFHNQVNKGYELISNNRRFINIDASKSIKSIHKKIITNINSLI